MKEIAQTSGLSKASLYSYFKTKEEVFATLFLMETESWFETVKSKLQRLRAPNEKRVAKVLTDALRERQRMCRLVVVLGSVLEKNLSTEFVCDFKTALQANLQLIIAEFQRGRPKNDQPVGNGIFIRTPGAHRRALAIGPPCPGRCRSAPKRRVPRVSNRFLSTVSRNR